MRTVNQLNAALNQKRGYCLEKERNVPGVLRVFPFRSQLDVVVEVVLPESKQWTTNQWRPPSRSNRDARRFKPKRSCEHGALHHVHALVLTPIPRKRS